MNNQQRKKIGEIRIRLENIAEELSLLATEEQDKWGNLPEGLQDSDQGGALEESAEALESAESLCSEAMEVLEEL